MTAVGLGSRRTLPGRAGYAALRLGLIIIGVATILPVVMMIVLAFRPTPAIDADPLGLPSSFFTRNFSAAWTGGSLGHAFLASIAATAASVAWLVVVGQLLAYVIVRRGGRSASAIFVYVFLGLMIPFPTRVLPLFSLMSSLHLTGSIISVIIFQAGSLLPLSVLIFRGFLRRIPRDYEDAACIDGASTIQVLRRIVMPMLAPASGAVATLAGIIIWNDFFTPLMLVGGSSSATLPVAIYGFVGEYTSDWGKIFAGLTLAALPVMAAFIALQNYLVRGLGSGLKG